ncbi:LytR/AlgR family response regulator transcription factor [uncultured Sphingobacterium sp.]|uniref:LytR/AlgR family response regulator transcription factor n=2 Tax=Sphingobacterium TaxID=28453 RepID=UPI00345B8901
MAKYDVMIIDDDPYDIRIAESALRQIKEVGDVRCFTKPIDGFNSIMDNPPDVLLLDVEMPEMSGMDLYQTLPMAKRPPVILCTNSQQYAYEAIKIAVADYLIKPVRFPELFVAFERALHQKNVHINMHVQSEPIGKWFIFKKMYRFVLFIDILAVSSSKNYATFHLRQAEDDFNYRITMDEVEAMLSKSTFVRVHRGFIVNVNFARKVVNRKILFPDRTDLDISVSTMGLIRLRQYA